MTEAEQSNSAESVKEHSLAALRMLCDVARICNEPAGLPSIGRSTLKRVCAFNGWFAGRLHVVDDLGVLRVEAAETTNDAPPGAATSLNEIEAALLDEVATSGETIWQRTAFPERGGGAVTAVCAPVRTNGTVLGALTLLSESRPPPRDEVRWAVETVATHFAGVIERRTLDRALAEAIGEEQQRLGRDLHDSVSQELTGVALVGDSIAKRLIAAGSAEAEGVRQMSANIRHALGSIRQINEGLLPINLDQGGLAYAIARMAKAVNEQSEIRIWVRGNTPRVPSTIARELFLITNEAVRNAVAHAEGSFVEIRWIPSERGGERFLTLEINDDGNGVPDGPGYQLGRGLSIMRHRASVIDGSLEVSHREGGGTTVRCSIPLQADEPEPSDDDEEATL